MEQLDLVFFDEKCELFIINLVIVCFMSVKLDLDKLQIYIQEIQSTLLANDGNSIMQYGVIGLYWLLVYSKFFWNVVTFITATIAILPILTKSMPEFLMPTIVSQTIVFVFLTTFELILTLVIVQFLVPVHRNLLWFYVAKLMFKFSFGNWALKKYIDFYMDLKNKQDDSESKTKSIST